MVLNLDSITIIDDDSETAEVVSDLIGDLGLNLEINLITNGPYDAPEQLIELIKQKGGRPGIVCDHRLQHQGLAAFYGSELLAKFYNEGIPGVLVTQFSEVDADTSIREYRKWLPTMIDRESITSDSLISGLVICQDEINGDLLVNRRAHRTLVNIVKITNEDGQLVADAFIPGWSPRHAVRFPLSSIKDDVRQSIVDAVKKMGDAYSFAMVNIGAKDSVELYFDGFEQAVIPGKSPLDSIFNLS